MGQTSEETAEKMMTTEEYLKRRQAAVQADRVWQGERSDEMPYALKLAELICV